MNTIVSKRNYLDNITLSKWFIDGHFVCYAVELPWRSNEPFVSCISPGDYVIGHHNTEERPNTFYLVNSNLGVGRYKGDSIRWGILIHIANFVKDIEGCIGPGLKLHPSTWGVSQSRDAMKRLRGIILDDSWRMTII